MNKDNKMNMAGNALLVASSGGHLQEMLRFKNVIHEYAIALVTEKTDIEPGPIGLPIKYVPQTNRKELLFPLKFLYLCVYSILTVLKLRPAYIITTGALIAVPFCIFGKMLGKKIIFIETFARIHSLSLSGKLIYPIADCFIVQWDELINQYPKALYGGIGLDISVCRNTKISDE